MLTPMLKILTGLTLPKQTISYANQLQSKFGGVRNTEINSIHTTHIHQPSTPSFESEGISPTSRFSGIGFNLSGILHTPRTRLWASTALRKLVYVSGTLES